MHKALHPRDDVDRLYVSRREGGRGRIDTTARRLHTKVRRKTDYGRQKQYQRHEDQRNDSNQKTKV